MAWAEIASNLSQNGLSQNGATETKSEVVVCLFTHMPQRTIDTRTHR